MLRAFHEPHPLSFQKGNLFFFLAACPGFTCDTDLCLPIGNVCDGTNDCVDGLDENEAVCARKSRDVIKSINYQLVIG